MKAYTFIFLLLIQGGAVIGQSMQMEAMGGNSYLFYQHNLSKQFFGSRFGVKHIASMVGWYNNKVETGGKSHEIMNQVYLTAKLNSYFTLMGGTFFTAVTGMRGSCAVQFAVKRPNLIIIVTPRADIIEKSAFDVFSLVEYSPYITDSISLYTRFQSMFNFGPQSHNRSYQQLRLGLVKKKTQLGIALNLDQYGERMDLYYNLGFFIRKDIF